MSIPECPLVCATPQHHFKDSCNILLTTLCSKSYWSIWMTSSFTPRPGMSMLRGWMQFSPVCLNMIWSWTQISAIFAEGNQLSGVYSLCYRSINITGQDQGGARMAETKDCERPSFLFGFCKLLLTFCPSFCTSCQTTLSTHFWANKEKGSKGNELLQNLWNQKSEDAFRELKDRLTSSSILVMQTLLDPSYWRRTLAAWTLGSPNAKPGGREKSYCICEPHSTKGRKEWC